MATLHLDGKSIPVGSDRFYVFWVLLYIAGILLLGWMVDLYQVATVKWMYLDAEDSIEPKKLLWLSIATGLVQVSAVVLGIVTYYQSWTFGEVAVWFAVLGILYAEALWIRHFTD